MVVLINWSNPPPQACTLLLEERKVQKAAYKLRRRILCCLLSTYVNDYRSLPPSVWGCPQARSCPHLFLCTLRVRLG